MKKILVFGITDNPGGIESVIMNYYRKFDKTKIQLDFLCNTKKVAYEKEITELGGKIYRITARSLNYKKYKYELRNFFQNNASKYEAIWVNVCSLANIDYLKYAKKYGIKRRIIHSHNSQNMDSFARGILHRYNKMFLKKYATDFWSCSEKSSKWFYHKNTINSDKYLLVNNAIDCNSFKYQENIRKKYREKFDVSDKFVIGNVGRLHFQKNQSFLIDVFSEFLKINSSAILMLIGDGEDRNKLEKKVEELKIENNVIFTGVRSDINNLYQMIDLFIFPSLFEGLSLSLLEAQASGVDCLISDTVASESIFSENVTVLPLNEPKNVWVENINRFKNTLNDREMCSKKTCSRISKAGYSIEFEAMKLQSFLTK